MEKINAAIKKGAEWLAKQQQKDGSYKGTYGTSYSMGTTSIAMLALLKAGVNPKSPCIQAGFSSLSKLSLSRMYSVCLYVMALEALYAPDEEELQKKGSDYVTVLRRNMRNRPSPLHKATVAKCIEWIIGHQQERIWRYPTGGEDLSNTQYSLLALYSGMRMGYKVPSIVFAKAARYMIDCQEKEGPEVEPFPVPAADFSIKELKKLEKEIRQSLKKRERESRKEGISKDGPSTTLTEDPYSRFGVERRSHKMFSRGWSYSVPITTNPQTNYKIIGTGSMTTAGLACSVIIKAGLEGSRYYVKEVKAALDKCIRDGAAWLATNFSVETNPRTGSTAGTSTHYLYYYLYGLERAGILSLCTMFGKHDWYNQGARYIISKQSPEGYWNANAARAARAPNPGQPAPPVDHVDTCFALLFLKRATVPVISLPKDIYTGGDLFADKNKKKDEQKKEGEGEESPPPAPEGEKKEETETPAQPAPPQPPAPKPDPSGK